MFWLSAKASKRGRSDPNRHRNICIALGCIAEKLAGPTSVALLTDSTLDYLIANLVCLKREFNYMLILNQLMYLYILGSIKSPTSSTVFIDCS
jgi:hypothetical protein